MNSAISALCWFTAKCSRFICTSPLVLESTTASPSTDFTEPSAAPFAETTAAPGMSVITTANMVGTVSATPGVGDAVIETGSGANGRYTKLADGTLICEIAGFPTTSGAAATWTLPASFATATYAVTATVTGTTPAVVTLDAPTTGSVDVHSFDLTGADTATPSVNLIALGRWF